MNNFTFDGIKKDYIRIISRDKPYWAERNVNMLYVPGMDGAYPQSIDVNPLIIPMTLRIEADSPEQLKERAEEMANWLVTDTERELIFDDRPNRLYYALINGGVNVNEIVTFSTIQIEFICPDPYKYGDLIRADLPSDLSYLEYNGTKETYPIIEMEVLTPITFAMIQNHNNEYMMIGEPVDDNVQVISDRRLVLNEEGETFDTWTQNNPNNVDEELIPNIGGSMTYDGTGIIATDYGPNTERIHGPTALKEIEPIQDFLVETNIDTRTDLLSENFRMELYMLDENFNKIGKIGINDNYRGFHHRRGLTRIGEYYNSTRRYIVGRANYDFKGDLGKSSLHFIRFQRKGNRFEVYFSVIDDGRHTRTLSRSYTDRTGEWLGRLRYIHIFIGSWEDRRPPYLARFNNIRVYELTNVTEDQTPYIAYEGDILTFNHEEREIYINGENAKEFKDFGANYFPIVPGRNELAILPSSSVNTNITYRERFK